MIPSLSKMKDTIIDLPGYNIEKGAWTPVLSCVNESYAPVFSYTRQIGEYYKVKMNNTDSLVFFNVYIVGNLTAIDSNQNGALIRGLPFTTSINGGTLTFSSFTNAIDSSHNLPIGYIVNSIIRIQNTTPANTTTKFEKWVTANNVSIWGTGLYITEQ